MEYKWLGYAMWLFLFVIILMAILQLLSAIYLRCQHVSAC